MHSLIEGVLAYSRIGRQREETGLYDTEPILANVLDSLGYPQHVKIKITTPLPQIQCNPNRISQVFQNLIDNAIKYNDKAICRINISCREYKYSYRFCVRDNGLGIDEKYHRKIFDIFQTLHNRDSSENTGIGLTMVKKIIELYGGKVYVRSTKGKGSSFYFTIAKTPVK
jgi:signal transduction histidine kinase